MKAFSKSVLLSIALLVSAAVSAGCVMEEEPSELAVLGDEEPAVLDESSEVSAKATGYWRLITLPISNSLPYCNAASGPCSNVGYKCSSGRFSDDYSVVLGASCEAPTIALPAPPSACGRLLPGEGLGLGATTALDSCDGRFRLQLQGDGNLVLYQKTSPSWTALWNTATFNGNFYSYAFYMQPDGNAVLYDPFVRPLWNSVTSGNNGAVMYLQNDGNLVIYNSAGPIWQSGTCCR